MSGIRVRRATTATYRLLAKAIIPSITTGSSTAFARPYHNHDDNPSDGSNWELVCLYRHDNEPQREFAARAGTGSRSAEVPAAPATRSPTSRTC